MKKIDKFINFYSVPKTLRFSLLPIGRTEENFNKKLLLEEDKKRAIEYDKVKSYIDRCHKQHIESVLSKVFIDGIKEYADLYYKTNKNDKDIKSMKNAEAAMRKTIAKALTNNQTYKSIFSKDIIGKVLPEFLKNQDEIASAQMFDKFTTYFSGFNKNRENMYSDEEKSTSVAYRCIHDNLPKFLDNALVFKKIQAILKESDLKDLDDNCMNTYGINVKDIFDLDYFSFVLSQSGIDKYNGIIGGYSRENGEKIQGLNEFINLHNQKNKTARLPLFKKLYKQILSDRESISFIPEKFNSDNEVLSAIKDYCNAVLDGSIKHIGELFSEFDSFDLNKIYITSGLAVTDISNAVFGKWSAVSESWNKEYEEKHPLKSGKNIEKYYETEKKEYKKIKSFSLAEIQRLGIQSAKEGSICSVSEYYKNTVSEKIKIIKENYCLAENLISSEYIAEKKLNSNDSAIALIKNLLDAFKELQRIVKPLFGTGKEESKDEFFYGKLSFYYESLADVDGLYNKVRNYVTQKPYSKDKIKLNFQNPQFLGGWDKNKERDYRTVILIKDNMYYLAVMDKSNNKAFINPPECNDGDFYEKVEYKLLPGANKMLPKVFFAELNKDNFSPSNEILDIRKRESFKKGSDFNLSDCHKLIDFFKASIDKHEDWSQFGFDFTVTEKYNDISEFYREVEKQGYSIKFKKIPVSYIDELVNNGELYLFQIYNKDFSKYSHGKPNLHTMYFKMLFDKDNLDDVVYQLNGGAEMFYREKSINKDEMIVHPANQPIKNKNIDNSKKTSTFAYDLIKDKRFTKRQFSLHLPITLNFKAKGQNVINNDVKLSIKNSDENYIIGIDRGERNLLYICVINSRGEIVEQKSLNEIISNNGYKVDYHHLLDEKEGERNKARMNWGTVENIKELKEGYLSQVIHEICKLVLKYDALIAMEDLNFGFKNGRFKVEKQVYQKFENMLIEKLNYLVDKNAAPCDKGGLLNAYQLTNKADKVNNARQNGIIFYVPAWLTSKIDPVTGFADLIRPKYTSVKEAAALIENIDDIRYNENENLFEFDIDYSKFPRCLASYRKKWTVCSNADRILTFRNSEKNSEWDNKTVILTDEFKKLFGKYNIDYKDNLKSNILDTDNAEFYRGFVKLFSLCLQMRNSKTGDVSVDYLISPVKDSDGNFYDSRDYSADNAKLPQNADANGAYNIALKCLWAVNKLKQTDDKMIEKVDLTIKNSDWLEFVQK